MAISQQSFAETTAPRFDVNSSRMTLLTAGLRLEEFDVTEPDGDGPFRELVGCLMWLANQTRPDISNAVRAVARYTCSPKEKHWTAAIGILGYVSCTIDSGITFQRGNGLAERQWS